VLFRSSGALTVIDDSHCIVDVVKSFAEFFLHESCGKCTPCRIGNKRIVEILGDIERGRGDSKSLALLKTLGENMKATAFCGLGQAAPNPLLRCLQFFEEEFIAHIEGKTCPAGICKFGRKMVYAK